MRQLVVGSFTDQFLHIGKSVLCLFIIHGISKTLDVDVDSWITTIFWFATELGVELKHHIFLASFLKSIDDFFHLHFCHFKIYHAIHLL